jgi:hypothetical protein
MKGGNNQSLSFYFSGFHDKKNHIFRPLRICVRRRPWIVKPTGILNRAIAVMNRVRAKGIVVIA